MFEKKKIPVNFLLPPGYDSYELRIFSSRNKPIAREDEVSRLDPNPDEKKYAKKYEGMYNFNYLFPVLDFKPDPQMEAILTFEYVFYGTCAMNPMYHPGRFQLSEKVLIPGKYLEWWENMFHYDNPQAQARDFYIRKTYPSGTKAISEEIELLSEFFQGRAECIGIGAEKETLLESQDIKSSPAPQIKQWNRDKITRESLLNALDADLEFIFKSQNRNKDSGMSGGTHLFYDYDAKTFRQRNWLWTYGPSMQTLLKARDIPELAAKYGKDTMQRMAVEMGDICLNRQELDRKKTYYGMLLCRLEHNVVNVKEGYELKYSPPDGLFQAGWGMMPLYRATGDKRYLDFCRIMTEATGELLEKDVVVQQDYFAVTGSWKRNTMDEAGFGMEGIAELYLETKDEKHAAIGKKYIDQLITYLEMPDGTWGRNYHRHSRSVEPPQNQTRGAGWAMMGISSATRMGLGDEYLNKCNRMAEVLMKYQRDDGSWWYCFSEPNETHGVEEKGTAVWAVMFYRLYRLTGNTRYLETARKALNWLIRRQYLGEDSDGYGGIPVNGPMSGVVYRPYFKLACQYTAGFFGLALLEELGLTK
ncbi:hypothetical protein AGMMS49546_37190 [Spirochaetia bacterium]|nr:hypothetical protein AGMMS49546_37190 [Spirochaetia bacterium]